MSRVGKAEIKIPSDVKIELADGGNFNYKVVTVTGSKGALSESIRRGVKIEIEGDTLNVKRDNDSKQNKSYHGLYRALIANMVKGVTEGYEKNLEIVGIGYRAEMQGTNVIFSLGYSHKITLNPPAGIVVAVDEQTKVKVSGADKQKVGEIASKIRAFRSPEPYKGKGIKYADEKIRRKSAKTV